MTKLNFNRYRREIKDTGIKVSIIKLTAYVKETNFEMKKRIILTTFNELLLYIP